MSAGRTTSITAPGTAGGATRAVAASSRNHPERRDPGVGVVTGVVVAYVLLYGVGQALSGLFTTPAGVSVWFPPAALTFVFLFVVPVRVGVPVAVGTRMGWSLLLGATVPGWVLVANALLTVGVYATAAQLLRRRVAREPAPTGPSATSVVQFFVLATILAPLCTAVATRLVAVGAGRVTWSAVPTTVVEFWIGDAVAIATLAPLAWALAQPEVRARTGTGAELVLGAAVAGLAGWTVLHVEIGGAGAPFYLVLVAVVGLAIRHALVGAAMGAAAAAAGLTGALAHLESPTSTVEAAHAFLVVAAVVGAATGLTERRRRQARDALAESEQRFREMVDAVEDYAIYRLEPDGTVATWNPGAQRLKGWTAESIIGQHIDLLHTPEDRAAGNAERLLDRARTAGTAIEEGWRQRRDGSRFWAEVTLTRIDDADGRLTGFTKITHDMTERREAARRLQERTNELARSNEELERFAAVASHDLQEPLRMVSSYSQLLERRHRPQLDDDARELLDHIIDGAARMRQLIQDLLDYSRIHTRSEGLQLVDLGSAVDDALHDLEFTVRETAAEVHVGDMPTIEGAPVRLRMVLQNVLGNALKYHRADRRPRIVVAAAPVDGGRWEISVADNGIGIPPDMRELVFEPFHRLHGPTEYPGTGIGMAICRRIVEWHHGRIWVEGNAAAGTTVRIQLPEHQTDPATTAGAGARAEAT